MTQTPGQALSKPQSQSTSRDNRPSFLYQKSSRKRTCDLEVCPPSGDCSAVPPRWRSAEQTVLGSVPLGLGEETKGSNRHRHHQLERQNKNSRHPNLEIRMYFLTRKIKFEEIFLWFYELSYQGKFKQLYFVKNYSELKTADTIKSRADVVAYWLFLKESIKVFRNKDEWTIQPCSGNCFHIISQKHHVSSSPKYRTFKIGDPFEILKAYLVHRFLPDIF